MTKIDLIIDALELASNLLKGVVYPAGYPMQIAQALFAARELKALQPVGEFMIAADINGKNCYIQVEDKDTFTFTLYALDDEVNHD